jgi:hypothetical protein
MVSPDDAILIVRRELQSLRAGVDPRITPEQLDDVARRIVVALFLAGARDATRIND